ncbi:MAG: DUF1987 domain-containing protein [Bacteroidales bacterium]|nr:DUF1987 domain-containing protein [Bacteroidales bacterium]
MEYSDLVQCVDLKAFSEAGYDGLEYVYRGEFGNAISQQILLMAEKDLDNTDGRETVKKRIFFIMVEGLQNITRHQDFGGEQKHDYVGVFFIQRKNREYIMTTGNVIENKDIEPLNEKLEKINSLEIGELKKHYLKRLKTGSLSDKGGAGLGLIEMARKSGNKLVYDFMPIDDEYSFFYFQTVSTISAVKPLNAIKLETMHGTLSYIKNRHKLLNQFSVQIEYKGNFSQSSILNLLGVIRKNKSKNKLQSKVSNIMIEMLQNTAKHGANKNENGPPACFYLMEKNNNFTLLTSNFIEKDYEEELLEKIKFVNSLNKKELNDYYNRVLLYFDADEKKTGLGLLDIRIKSGQKIGYTVLPYSQEFAIFSIYININLSSKKMKSLIIESTEETPQVEFNAIESKFIIAQRSLPENAIEFYEPILSWIEEYSKDPNVVTIFEFDFEYFNTASSKQVIKILLLLENLTNNSEVKIKWHYRDYDEDMLQNGQRYSSLVDIDFEFIEIEEED